MTGIKQSDFNAVTSIDDADNVPLFTAYENKRITYANMRTQLTDEIAVRFIYPTTAQLQQSNLEADEDEPNYVRCEETEYRLYKITALAAGVDDIALDNGMTASYQEEYSKSGFVLGAASSTNNALALFDGATGTQLKTGAVLSTIGGNLASAVSVAQVSYPRVDASNAVTMATPTTLKTDLNLPSNTATSIAAIEGDISAIEDDIVDINADIDTKVGTVESWAAISAITPIAAGQVFTLKQHTSGGLGGGTLMAFVGSVTDDGGTQKNCLGGYFLKRVGYQDLYVEMFGGVPDNGVTNNYTAIVNGMAAAAYNKTGKTRLLFNYGVYAISATLPQQTTPVRLVGVGNGDPGSPVTVTTGTQIKYTGGFVGTWILSFKEVWYGNAGVDNITFLCQNNCRGVEIDSCSGMSFNDVQIREDNYIGLEVTSSTTTTCSWNTFTNTLVDDFYASSGIAGIRCTGGPGLGNACHNVFINTKINHNLTRQGLILGYCDNVTFYMTYIFKVGGAGYGVYGDSSLGGGFPGNNTFYHLQAMGGYYQDATSATPSAVIYGYQKDNGEPDPVNAGSDQASITWYSDNGRVTGAREYTYRPLADQSDLGSDSIVVGQTQKVVSMGVQANTSTFHVKITPTSDPQQRYWVSNKVGGPTSSFRVNVNSAIVGSDFNFDYHVTRISE